VARFKSLLLGVEVKEAGRRSTCAHSRKHVIIKGEPRLVVKGPGVATPEKGYCVQCGAAMVAQAEQQLDAVRSRFGSA
jgi:uncharacterized Zn-binding protein involved in type VI secretion